MTFKTTFSLVSGFALALAACGDSEPEPDANSMAADMEANQTAEYDPMERDYPLSEEIQARRDAFDSDAFQAEYSGFRDEIAAEQIRMGANMDPDAEMTEDDRAEMEAASQPRDASTNMRTRSNMTWSYLDRNDDDQLSVAEYAIWAVPLDPNATMPNDQGEPQLSADQANRAADSFFYYDIDGDTYLSRREFTSARRGENYGS
ncbi:hypothetical protein [Qipengyuania spongiae]|uniref:EF-hand domain-containing protein n=1 Tax=Qipengyuania spongiae TaxID=2909673 RepID=A0ABY5T077_9SPHN|nr:hypothetical protein [Qipengyuania spongiae]UVI38731.1 hypothetical protein L1F33_10785 [Qipengyuania spongiae]